jgi:hypothetical protein
LLLLGARLLLLLLLVAWLAAGLLCLLLLSSRGKGPSCKFTLARTLLLLLGRLLLWHGLQGCS